MSRAYGWSTGWYDIDDRGVLRPYVDTDAMFWPVQCIPCGHIHDAGKVEIEGRYLDCTTWRCPRCKTLLDDRPRGWGGNTRKIEKR
jgi:hypothetical protein